MQKKLILWNPYIFFQARFVNFQNRYAFNAI